MSASQLLQECAILVRTSIGSIFLYRPGMSLLHLVESPVDLVEVVFRVYVLVRSDLIQEQIELCQYIELVVDPESEHLVPEDQVVTAGK